MRKEITKKELEALRKSGKIIDWAMTSVTVERANQYVTKNFETESFLKSHREELHVTVYKLVGKKIGDSSIVVTEDDVAGVKTQLKEAVILCKYSVKDRYTIPGKMKSGKKVQLADTAVLNGFKKDTLHKNMQNIVDKVSLRLRKYKNIKLNGMELLVSASERKLENSKKVKLSQKKTNVYIEANVTATKGDKEMEYLKYTQVSRLSDLKIDKFVDDTVSNVKDVMISRRSKHFTGNIVLSGDAMTEFFMPEMTLNPLFIHCSARLKYMGINKYEIGKNVAEFKGDKITAHTNPLLQYNTASTNFDQDGIPSQRLKILDKGVFTNYIASKQYADYLKVKPTGAAGSIEIAPGSKKKSDLYKGRVIEIVSFSSFAPNSISGDFSAEIRLGYEWSGGKKKPFKGGMFTGNAFKLAENLYFSKELKKEPSYYGPKAVLFKDAVIAGL